MTIPVLFLDFASTIGGLDSRSTQKAPVRVAELVNELAGSGAVEVRWLTNMPKDVVQREASNFGFVEFAVHEDPHEEQSVMSWWKGSAVASHVVDGGAAIWCDREIDDETAEHFSGERVGLIQSSSDGLTSEQVDRIRAFVANGCRAADALTIIEPGETE